jgi:hypothetical protein
LQGFQAQAAKGSIFFDWSIVKTCPEHSKNIRGEKKLYFFFSTVFYCLLSYTVDCVLREYFRPLTITFIVLRSNSPPFRSHTRLKAHAHKTTSWRLTRYNALHSASQEKLSNSAAHANAHPAGAQRGVDRSARRCFATVRCASSQSSAYTTTTITTIVSSAA